MVAATIFPKSFLLGQYYSVDFPWWFDRKFSKTTNKIMTAKKKSLNDKNLKPYFKIWQKKPSFSVEFHQPPLRLGTNLQINLEAKYIDWKKNYYIIFYSNCSRLKVFSVNGLYWTQFGKILIWLLWKIYLTVVIR